MRARNVVLLCFLAFSPALAAFAQTIPDSDKARVLRMLSAHNKRTPDGLTTWQGVFQVQDIEWFYGDRAERFLDDHAPDLTSRPSEFKKLVSGRATFSVDFQRDCLFSRFESDSVDMIDLATGDDVGINASPFNQTSIITSEHFLHFEPNVRYATPEGAGVRTAFRDVRERAAGQEWGAIIDPRALLGYGRPIWENLQMIADAMDPTGRLEVDGIPLQMLKEGTGDQEEYHVILPLKIGSERYMLQEMTFRADAGFNITLLVVRESAGPVHQQMRWRYTEREGLFLPSMVERKWISPDGSRIMFERTLSLVTSEINRPLSPETFAYQNLGLQEGDRLIDKLAGDRVSVFEGGTLKPLDLDAREVRKPAGLSE